MTKNVDSLKSLLAIKQNQINSLLELTKAINNNFSRAALIKLFEFIINGQLGVEKVALFVKEEDWVLVIDEGNNKVSNKINVEEDLVKFGVIQDVTRYPGELFEGFETIIPIVHKKNPLAFVLVGDLNLSELESKDETLKYIETTCNFILVSLENKRLFSIQLEQERIGKEVELASQVQGMLIPSALPSNEDLDVAGFYQPHGSIGGDYYDFISLDDGNVAFCICDVSGKGISAGMIMANFQAQLRSLLNKYDSLEQLVDHLNYKLYEITNGERYITMFLGLYNHGQRKLRYISAGHNPTLLHQQGDIINLDKGCTILGAFDQLPVINSEEIILDKDALIFCYTDGLSELENDHNEMYGMDNLNRFIFQHANESVGEIIKRLEEEMVSYKGDKDYNDDVSALVCRFF